jgi:hypothetical protein
VTATLGKTRPDRMGNVAYVVWAAGYRYIRLTPYADAGAGSIAALTAAGAVN